MTITIITVPLILDTDTITITITITTASCQYQNYEYELLQRNKILRMDISAFVKPEPNNDAKINMHSQEAT